MDMDTDRPPRDMDDVSLQASASTKHPGKYRVDTSGVAEGTCILVTLPCRCRFPIRKSTSSNILCFEPRRCHWKGQECFGCVSCIPAPNTASAVPPQPATSAGAPVPGLWFGMRLPQYHNPKRSKKESSSSPSTPPPASVDVTMAESDPRPAAPQMVYDEVRGKAKHSTEISLAQRLQSELENTRSRQQAAVSSSFSLGPSALTSAPVSGATSAPPPVQHLPIRGSPSAATLTQLATTATGVVAGAVATGVVAGAVASLPSAAASTAVGKLDDDDDDDDVHEYDDPGPLVSDADRRVLEEAAAAGDALAPERRAIEALVGDSNAMWGVEVLRIIHNPASLPGTKLYERFVAATTADSAAPSGPGEESSRATPPPPSPQTPLRLVFHGTMDDNVDPILRDGSSRHRPPSLSLGLLPPSASLSLSLC
jgi:hypothetical protein